MSENEKKVSNSLRQFRFNASASESNSNGNTSKLIILLEIYPNFHKNCLLGKCVFFSYFFLKDKKVFGIFFN